MEASAVAAEMTAVVSGSSFSYAVAAETAMATLSAAAVVDAAAAADAETIVAAASIPSRHANGIRRRTIKWSGIRVRTASRSNSAGIFFIKNNKLYYRV